MVIPVYPILLFLVLTSMLWLLVLRLLEKILCYFLSHWIWLQISLSKTKHLLLNRFGKASAADGLDSTKQSEDLKRKARAERFGPSLPLCAYVCVFLLLLLLSEWLIELIHFTHFNCSSGLGLPNLYQLLRKLRKKLDLLGLGQLLWLIQQRKIKRKQGHSGITYSHFFTPLL